VRVRDRRALLVPRGERRSLSDVAGELRDGVYRTPGFELPKTLWDGVFDRGDPRRVEMFIFEFGLARSATASRCKFLRLGRRSLAGLLCTIDKIDRDLERTEQPGCRTTRHIQRGKR
jgi:hypothetical protein